MNEQHYVGTHTHTHTCRHTHRCVEKWNRIENPDMNPDTYRHLIIVKEVIKTHFENESILNKWFW